MSIPSVQGAYRAKRAAAYLDMAESTFWRHVSEGRIPPGIRLSPRCTVWPVEDLQALLKRESAATEGKP
jgi:predicted DNA-binding transcriptional regulator AlpA